jgi:hypothetical protein
MRKGIPGEDHCGFATTEQGPWKTEYGLDGDDKGKDGEDFELFAKGKEGKGMGRAFLVRTTAGLRQPSKDRGKTEHGLLGKEMGYGIIVRTTAGSRELSKDRGQLAWVFINENYHRYRSRTVM